MVADANPNEMLTFLKSKGLKVEETKSLQKTLDGRTLNYHSVTGYREGSYKITIRFSPEPKVLHFVVNAKDNSAASDLADRLDRELGIDSDVDDDVVRGQTRRISKDIIGKIIKLAEEASHR